MKLIKKILICSSLLLGSVETFAAIPSTSGPWEVSAAAGANWLHASDADTVIVDIPEFTEIDSNKVNRTTDSAIWKLGVGYHLFQNQLQCRSFLNDVLLGLNYYYTKASVYGVVEQFQLPEFTNFTFHAPVRSQRLMLDIKPQLFSYQRVSPYAILGLGVAWNKLGYSESIIDPGTQDPASAIKLNDRTSGHLAYEAGLGLRLALSQHLSGSLEYLYAGLGRGTPGNSVDPTYPISNPPGFNLHTQSLLLGLNWIF